MIDLYAPIVPYRGLGGIRLYSTMDELADILKLDAQPLVLHGKWIRYDIQDSVELFFLLRNRKLFRIVILANYRGKLFGGISVGSTEEELLTTEPSFCYNDFEEVREAPKGVWIEMDRLGIQRNGYRFS